MTDVIRTNCPRDCYDACGIIVEKRPGAQPRILGDPDHPVSRGRLCSKCAIAYNGVWQKTEARLKYPQRRVGKKGEAHFERVSWDEALAETATRLWSIIDSHGAESILHTHYTGMLSLLAFLFPNRLFNYLGASEVDPDTMLPSPEQHPALLHTMLAFNDACAWYGSDKSPHREVVRSLQAVVMAHVT